MYIYILQLQNNKYYVGKTNNPNFRLDQHFDGYGAAWTKKYKPIKVIELIDNCDDLDEDKYTFKYMKKYGIDNVRGGSFCQVILDSITIKIIKRMIDGASDKCFRCGKIGHFVNNCPNKNINNDIDSDEELIDLIDLKNDFLNECRKIDVDNSKILSLNNILIALKDCNIAFGNFKLTNIRGLCQSINNYSSLKYIDYSKDKSINYTDFIDGLSYILNNDKDDNDNSDYDGYKCEICNKVCDCYEELEQHEKYCKKKKNIKKYTKQSYTKKYTKNNTKQWKCNYCPKIFTTYKGAKYHENFYCGVNKTKKYNYGRNKSYNYRKKYY